MTTEPELLAERRGRLGLITLNRPKALNSLNMAMLKGMDAQLRAWAKDPQVSAVAVRGAGEAVLRRRRRARGGRVLKDPGSTHSQDFFLEEYVLNRRIHRYQKPYIALLDGVSMGGGFGVSLHGSHRVGTEKLSFAMPETTIGLFPDVGGTWFLTRCPGEVGMYLGLTGRRVGLADAVYCGYATHHVPRERLPALRDQIFAAAPRDRGAVDALIAPLAAPAGEPSLAAERARIDRCFGHDSVEAILAR